MVVILEHVEYVSLTQERERRWMFHYFQAGAPLLNYEAKFKYLIVAIQSTDVDFLTLPLSSPVWKDLLTAYEKDRSEELEERRKARLRAGKL